MDKSFEEQYKKIEAILDKIESNKDNLDESIKLYTQAKKMYKNLEEKLIDYKAKLEVVCYDD
ncbi:exodeoxyribonuclease VII small subunit [uncultured Anaerococcus sp.]|uniref:exodeoxyribonuclease VII small subunit n=1 Tax=uncultured Anaerococcus sp. TaxID=293428 RepID=UPI0025F67944|nr:exodeoxyribonuclease VII small subunit [uncultured Anaerococcus sp.]